MEISSKKSSKNGSQFRRHRLSSRYCIGRGLIACCGMSSRDYSGDRRLIELRTFFQRRRRRRQLAAEFSHLKPIRGAFSAPPGMHRRHDEISGGPTDYPNALTQVLQRRTRSIRQATEAAGGDYVANYWRRAFSYARLRGKPRRTRKI